MTLGPCCAATRCCQFNWTSHTLVAHQRQLAHLATGGARAQALQTGRHLRDRQHAAEKRGRQPRTDHLDRCRRGPRRRSVGHHHPRDDHRPRRLHRPADPAPHLPSPARAHPARLGGQHMVTTELTTTSSRARARATLAATAALCATTAGSALAGTIAPGLVSPVAPHPTLTPTLGAWAAILLDNSRVLALPILLTAFGFYRGPLQRPHRRHRGHRRVRRQCDLRRPRTRPLAEPAAPVPAAATRRVAGRRHRRRASGHTPAQPPDDPTAAHWPFMPESSSGC